MTEIVDNIIMGDCLDLFPKVEDNSVRTIHTSPPYNIARDYEGYSDDLNEEEYLDRIKEVLSECNRLHDGTGRVYQAAGPSHIQLVSRVGLSP